MTREERIKYREKGILEFLNSQYFQELLKETNIDAPNFTQKLHKLLNTRYNNVDNITIADRNDYADYNNEDYNALLLTLMYLYHKTKGVDKLDSDIAKIPYELWNISRDIAYNEFIQIINKLKTKIIPYTDKSQYEEILQLATEKLLFQTPDTPCINSQTIAGVRPIFSDTFQKLFLSIPKKDLCKFLNILLKKCVKYRIEDFNIFPRPTVSWGIEEDINSITIFFTKENFAKYIKAIQEIKQEEPSIQFNTPNLYSYYYNRDIAITLGNIDGQEGKNLSTLLTLLITKGLKKKLSNEELAQKISTGLEKIIEEKLHDLITLCEETKKALDNIFIEKPMFPIFTIYSSNNQRISPQEKKHLIEEGKRIIGDNKEATFVWIDLIEREFELGQGSLLRKTLYIIMLLKQANPPYGQIQNILDDEGIIIHYLNYIVKPEILEQITTQPPQKPKPKK